MEGRFDKNVAIAPDFPKIDV